MVVVELRAVDGWNKQLRVVAPPFLAEKWAENGGEGASPEKI